ncbi:hypothetical protein ACN4EK_22275 [Pantanalinema rosaneae CENA516]
MQDGQSLNDMPSCCWDNSSAHIARIGRSGIVLDRLNLKALSIHP